MKLAFSTLGVPGLPLTDVPALATAHGYHGVELRAHPEEPVHPGLGPAERADAAARFKEAGVEILGLAGYARVAAPGADEPVLTEIRALLDLARDLGAPYVRVFPGGGTEQSPEEADAVAARRLGTAAEYAADVDVRILLETHDSHPTGADAMRILGLVGHRQVGALWDVMHTWLGGEQPVESYAALSRTWGTSRSRTSPPPTTRRRCRSGRGCCRWRTVWRCSPGTGGTAGCAGSTRSGGTTRRRRWRGFSGRGAST
ncbi:hypothetical protein SHKM778_80780 [Streptomyces sp. KM77-8]|uniref:Xylose isomerase-like TIM barrel domain-containing protein n=1 Tax=Streptomyces haneummycinicus TaxID=3074435 RepID=A0AAT9HWN2_9ACTN